MLGQSKSLDEIDTKILETLQKDCRTTQEQIAKKLGIPKSTIHYRIKRLEKEGIIKGYYAEVDAAKLGKDYIAMTFVRAKFGLTYQEKVGRMLSEIPGVIAVYFVFGEMDFVVLTRSESRDDFIKKLEMMAKMSEIERTNTLIVARTIKEDPRIELKTSI